MNREKLGELMGELEAPDTSGERQAQIMTEISDGFNQVIASQEKMQEDFNKISKKNLKLQEKNSHYANRLAVQHLDMEDRQEQKKQEEKKNRTLSDALRGL